MMEASEKIEMASEKIDAPLPPLVLAADYAGASTSSTTLVEGELRFMHYSCDGFCDDGWGCGLRTVQSILSWLSPQRPPSIPELQSLLGHAVGSTSWIGVQDAVELLDVLHDARVEVLPLSAGRELVAHLPRLASHFVTGGGPLMIGGGADVYSKTVIGVDPNAPALLILDPHYVGRAVHAHDIEALRAGGWAVWKPLSSALSDGSFYNVALPRRPAGGQGRGVRRAEVACASGSEATASWAIEIVEEGCEGGR